MVYAALYVIVGVGPATAFCFIPALGIAIGFPWGASKLIGVLTNNPDRSCCTFFVEGIPFTLVGKRSAARENDIRSIDQASRSGRFALSKIGMAEVIEMTAIRVWLSICCYIVVTMLFIVTIAIEVGAGNTLATDPRHREHLSANTNRAKLKLEKSLYQWLPLVAAIFLWELPIPRFTVTFGSSFETLPIRPVPRGAIYP